MALPPLTHHEILGLAGPFAASGRSVDLAASDRVVRQVAFRPRERDGLVERLQLDCERDDAYTLVRRIAPADGGPDSSLAAEGSDPAELLARIDAVPPDRQWRREHGAVLALHRRVAADGSLSLQRAEAHLPRLVLGMSLSGVSGYPAEITLQKTGGARLDLPTDVLAVLGRAWERLTPLKSGWIGSIAVHGKGAARSADAEARLVRTVQHLSQTLAEPPARFHERYYGARWRVAMRGTLPVAVGIALVAFAFAMRGREDSASVLAILANIAPPLLMGLFFMRREMPLIGLPRPPRRPPANAWETS